LARITIALGGNAILRPDQVGTYEEQLENIQRTCSRIATLALLGHDVIITHGNGPQVGNILLQNEEAYRSAAIPPVPLDACGAESQGLIGYMIQRTLRNELSAAGIEKDVVSMVTQVLVDRNDPAFANPQKPIGPFYTEKRAERLVSERGYVMIEDANRGFRRVVPSPEPRAIVERQAIERLVESGYVVIASGGGGVPVVRDEVGRVHGVEAVVDKDLAGQQLASDLHSDLFLVLTDVEMVLLNFGRPSQKPIARAYVDQVRKWQAEGHFRPGSMGPKIEAAVRFVSRGGKEAIITSIERASAALSGEGTHVLPEPV